MTSYSYWNIKECALYLVELLSRARRQWQEMAGTRDEPVVKPALDQLALRPRPEHYWNYVDHGDFKIIYAGENRDWMITYEIDDAQNVVFVHSIEPRPTRSLDPR